MKDFLFTLLAWILALPFIIGSVLFALNNQALTPVAISPFQEALPMPLYVPVLGAIAIGFLFGSLMTWAAMGRLRTMRRDQAKRIKTLEKQLEVVNTRTLKPHDYGAMPVALLAKKS